MDEQRVLFDRIWHDHYQASGSKRSEIREQFRLDEPNLFHYLVKVIRIDMNGYSRADIRCNRIAYTSFDLVRDHFSKRQASKFILDCLAEVVEGKRYLAFALFVAFNKRKKIPSEIGEALLRRARVELEHVVTLAVKPTADICLEFIKPIRLFGSKDDIQLLNALKNKYLGESSLDTYINETMSLWNEG